MFIYNSAVNGNRLLIKNRIKLSLYSLIIYYSYPHIFLRNHFVINRRSISAIIQLSNSRSRMEGTKAVNGQQLNRHFSLSAILF